MIQAQLYLRCIKCGGVPEWSSVEYQQKEDGTLVVRYRMDEEGCPLCAGQEFEVVEVKPEMRLGDGSEHLPA